MVFGLTYKRFVLWAVGIASLLAMSVLGNRLQLFHASYAALHSLGMATIVVTGLRISSNITFIPIAIAGVLLTWPILFPPSTRLAGIAAAFVIWPGIVCPIFSDCEEPGIFEVIFLAPAFWLFVIATRVFRRSDKPASSSLIAILSGPLLYGLVMVFLSFKPLLIYFGGVLNTLLFISAWLLVFLATRGPARKSRVTTST